MVTFLKWRQIASYSLGQKEIRIYAVVDGCWSRLVGEDRGLISSGWTVTAHDVVHLRCLEDSRGGSHSAGSLVRHRDRCAGGVAVLGDERRGTFHGRDTVNQSLQEQDLPCTLPLSLGAHCGGMPYEPARIENMDFRVLCCEKGPSVLYAEILLFFFNS